MHWLLWVRNGASVILFLTKHVMCKYEIYDKYICTYIYVYIHIYTYINIDTHMSI